MLIVMVSWQQKYFENLENFQPFGTLKYLEGTRGMMWMVTYIEPFKLFSILMQKFLS